jgi:hypothetical protein
MTLSIPALFEQAFGYRSRAFEPQFKPQSPERTIDNPYYSGRSLNGSPYTAVDKVTGREYYMPVTLGGMSLPFPVVSVTCRKHIIETPLVERRGTVKELISIEDWDIKIKGLIVSTSDVYPEEAVTQLRDLFERNEAIEMQNAITDIFLITPDRKGSDLVVIKDISFPEVRGVMNVRAYELSLVSDAPFDLKQVK